MLEQATVRLLAVRALVGSDCVGTSPSTLACSRSDCVGANVQCGK